MNRKDYEKLNNLSVSLGYLTSLIELAEHMAGEYVCGNVTDDEEKVRVHIDRLWSLLNGMVELSHLREQEIETLLKLVPIIEDAP
ncbi:hypothetical protein D3Z36_11880 [Lachnospiraceae bacterium]|nr:hypothetical protein [Lachnospiraceae bacterium]